MDAYNDVFKRYKLTIIFMVMGKVATITCLILYAIGIQDKRWYWLIVGSGVWVWLVSLALRPIDGRAVLLPRQAPCAIVHRHLAHA